MVESVIQLKCGCNNYPWGKKGSESLAATLCAKTPGTDFKIDESKDYAEMWFGTYPELPSYVLSSGKDLQDVLDANHELIGEATIKKFGDTKLPFLPKVLSIAKALPLQLHPNKELAAKLHKEDPKNFTDPNHKPEIAIALSKFEAFCGWKPSEDIEATFELEPLKRYLPEKYHGHFNDGVLKKVTGNILSDSDESIKQVQKALLDMDKSKLGTSKIHELLPRLQAQYGDDDPGNLVALLCMNYMVLSPGESIYIPADGIHAYLAGDIIECMARSNNVLNTGFCPRAERNSVELFTSTLTFVPHNPEDAMLKPTAFERSKTGGTVCYAPPMSEFNMLLTDLKSGEDDVVGGVGGPSVMIVTSGEGKMAVQGKEYDLETGFIFFVGQGVDVALAARKDMQVYRAYVE